MNDFLEYAEEIIDAMFLCLRSTHDDSVSVSVSESDSDPVVAHSKSITIAEKILLDNFKQRDSLKDMNLEVDKNGNIIDIKTIDQYESIVKNMINVTLHCISDMSFFVCDDIYIFAPNASCVEFVF